MQQLSCWIAKVRLRATPDRALDSPGQCREPRLLTLTVACGSLSEVCGRRTPTDNENPVVNKPDLAGDVHSLEDGSSPSTSSRPENFSKSVGGFTGDATRVRVNSGIQECPKTKTLTEKMSTKGQMNSLHIGADRA